MGAIRKFFTWYAASTAVFAPIGMVSAMLTPPDPSLAPLTAAEIVGSWLVGYWLAYRDGFETVRGALDERPARDG